MLDSQQDQNPLLRKRRLLRGGGPVTTEHVLMIVLLGSHARTSVKARSSTRRPLASWTATSSAAWRRTRRLDPDGECLNVPLEGISPPPEREEHGLEACLAADHRRAIAGAQRRLSSRYAG